MGQALSAPCHSAGACERVHTGKGRPQVRVLKQARGQDLGVGLLGHLERPFVRREQEGKGHSTPGAVVLAIWSRATGQRRRLDARASHSTDRRDAQARIRHSQIPILHA
jgi:hypothetical protein